MTYHLPDPIKLTTRRVGDVRIHTFLSAYTDINIADATHVIESKTKLVVIDGQFLVPYAKQFREYVDFLAASTGKPVERLYLTHRHPDHWFGLQVAFADLPIFALPETIEFLQTGGQDQIKSHKEKFATGPYGDLSYLIPDDLIIPKNEVIIPNENPKVYVEEIDGLRYVFSKLVDTEIDYHMIIGLPDINVCIVQDLIYSETHLYLTKDEDLGNWIRFLEEMAVSDYDLFLSGHGLPADKREVARNIEYLWAARIALANGLTGDAFRQYLLQRYPARLCPEIFDIYLPRLFPPPPPNNP